MNNQSDQHTQEKLKEEFKEQAISSLQKLYLFKGLNRKTCCIFLDRFKLIKYKDKAVIFSEGDNCDYFLVIIAGKLDVVKVDIGCVNQLKQGNICGEFGILLNQKRSASAISNGNTILLKIYIKDINNMMESHPKTIAIMMKNLAGSLAKQVIELTH